MKGFKIGDRVEGIDEPLKGTIRSLKNEEAAVETEEGFVIDIPLSQLIPAVESNDIKVSNYEVSQVISEKEQQKRRKQAKVKPKERNLPKMEVDLHIHELTENVRGMSNYDMLTIQLETAKRQLEFAMRKRIQKVVFIHGVGQGVLKTELEYLFGRYENVTWYDADYQKYGLGATEVYIYQNV